MKFKTTEEKIQDFNLIKNYIKKECYNKDIENYLDDILKQKDILLSNINKTNNDFHFFNANEDYLLNNIVLEYSLKDNQFKLNLHNKTFEDKKNNVFTKDKEFVDLFMNPKDNFYKTKNHDIIDCLYKIEGYKNGNKKMIYIGSTNMPIKRMMEHFDIYKNNGRKMRNKSRQFHLMVYFTDCDVFNITFYQLKSICNKKSFIDDDELIKDFSKLVDDIYLSFNEDILTEKTIKDNLNENLLIISGGNIAAEGKNILIDNE